MQDQPPTFPDKVIGYRMWFLIDDELVPMNMWRGTWRGGTWRVGPSTAACRQGGYHVAPDPDCECGLYAWHDPDDYRLTGSAAICGAVTAWGNIEVHAKGFRAQYAEPVVFAFRVQSGYSQYCQLKKFTKRHGRQLVPFEELAQYAAAYGQPVAPELRPASPFGLEENLRDLSTVTAAYMRKNAAYQQWNLVAAEGWDKYYKANRKRLR